MINFTPEQKMEILRRIGAAVTTKAKRLAPVDTGKLRNSIGYTIVGDSKVTVFCTVDYASYLEFGTRSIRIGTPESPRRLPNNTFIPFMRSAIYSVQGNMSNIIKGVV